MNRMPCADQHQAPGLRDRQTLQQNRIHERKNRSVGTDAERERQHGDAGKSGRADKQPQRITQILPKSSHIQMRPKDTYPSRLEPTESIMSKVEGLMRTILLGFAAAAIAAIAADAPTPSIGKIVDNQIRLAEREVVSLAEAIPAEKYGFAPSAGEFEGVRTFSQQMTHIPAVNFIVASAALGEKNPSDTGPSQHPPPSSQR